MTLIECEAMTAKPNQRQEDLFACCNKYAGAHWDTCWILVAHSLSERNHSLSRLAVSQQQLPEGGMTAHHSNQRGYHGVTICTVPKVTSIAPPSKCLLPSSWPCAVAMLGLCEKSGCLNMPRPSQKPTSQRSSSFPFSASTRAIATNGHYSV